MATKYVDFDNGLDTNTGDSPGDAYKTLDKALTVQTDGGLIELLYGINGNHAGQVSLRATTSTTKNLTIHGNSSGETQVKIQPSGTSWPVLTLNEDEAGTITFQTAEDCTFSGATNDVKGTSGTNTTDRQVTLTDCTMITATGDLVDIVDGHVAMSNCTVDTLTGRYVVDLSGALGNVTLDGLTGTPARLLDLSGTMLDLTVDNCNIETTDSGGSSIVVGDNLTALGNVRIKDNIFTFIPAGIIIDSTLMTGFSFISGNTVNVSAPIAGGSGIQVGVEFSDVTDWASGQGYVVDDVRDANGRVYICHQANTSTASDEPGVGANWKQYWEPFKLRRPIIQDNNITMGTATAHTIFVGVGADNAVVICNKASGGNFQGVSKAEGTVWVGNILDGEKPLSFFSLPSNFIMNNTLRSTTASPCFVLGDQAGTYTSDNYAINNIVAQEAAAVCFSDDGNPSDGDDYLNHSDLFRLDGSNIALLGGASRADLTALQAQWAVQSDILGDVNDQNSISENPQFTSPDTGDYTPTNPDVLKGGKPDAGSNETVLGAIEPGLSGESSAFTGTSKSIFV
jgi:hypothetical protein